MDGLGKSLVELVEKKTEKLMGIMGVRILELLVGMLHGETNHILPKGGCLFTATCRSPHEFKQMDIGLNHLV
jgi:hypothetical protein